jgi:tight adherence protein C
MIVLALLGVGALTVRQFRRRRARRSRSVTLRALPDAIDIIVAALRAGVAPIESLHFAARHAPVEVRNGFVACIRAHQDGALFHESLEELPRLLGSGVWPVVDLLRDQVRLGVPVVDTAEQLAIEARSTRRRWAEESARELPVRLSLPLVLCTLPSFIALVIAPVIISAFTSVSIG